MDSKPSRQEGEHQHIFNLDEIIEEKAQALEGKPFRELVEYALNDAELQRAQSAEMKAYVDSFTSTLNLIKQEKRELERSENLSAKYNYRAYVERFAEAYKALCEQKPHIATSKVISNKVIEFIRIVYREKALANGLEHLVNQNKVEKNPDTETYSILKENGKRVYLDVLTNPSFVEKVQKILVGAINALPEGVDIPVSLDRALQHFVAEHPHDVIILGKKVITRPLYLDTLTAIINNLASIH